jgi:hypothetical protein
MPMRSDVHSKALRAAAKVAFSVVFLGGCSSAGAQDANDPTDTEGTSEADLKSGCAGARATKDAAPPKLSCEQVVASAFPTEGNYPGKKKSISAEAQTCCVELLEKSQGALAAHRWDCCANLPADAGQEVGIACTPWGPPVPPRMRRRSLALAMQVLA